MRLRGLMTISFLVFILASIALITVIIDDKKDLSSRASLGVVNTPNKPLQLYEQAKDTGFYNSIIWQKIEPNLYLNSNNSDTVRILPASFNSSSISATLGKEFIKVGSQGVSGGNLGDWSQEKFTYQLFGETKKVNLWRSSQASLLEVGSEKNSTTETVEFLKNIPSNLVLGSSTTTPDDSAKMATLIRPSVAMILNHYCAELKFFSAPDFPLSNKVYPFCLTSVGTGFFISEDGLMATNGHIVKNFPKSALYYGISSGKLDTLLSDFLGVYLSQQLHRQTTPEEVAQKIKEAHNNKEVLYQVGGLILDLNKKNILKFQNEKYGYFLQIGNTPATITNEGVKITDGIVKANLVDIDYEEPNDQTGFNSSDVALLKADGGIYPGLELGSLDEAYVGSNLQVVGFPAASMGTGDLLDSASVSEPTFTKGLVSAIKLAKGNQKKLIQTDAIINHGNSGGPALLQNGHVVGVANYGVASENGLGSYNFLRDIQDVKDLVQKQNQKLSQGKIFTLWQEGLNNYWLGYFKYSQKSFSELKSLYPQHPLVEKYLSSVNTKINTVEDLTPKFTHKQRGSYIFLSSLIMSISGLTAIVSLFLIYRQKSSPPNLSDTSIA